MWPTVAGCPPANPYAAARTPSRSHFIRPACHHRRGLMPTYLSALASGATHCSETIGLHVGDSTSHALAIHSVVLHATCLANQRLCHVATELVVCNDATSLS